MILDELAAHARERVAADKAKISLEDMKAQAEALTQGDFRFEKALAGKDCAFICEVKKASPSKGVIDPVFDFEKIAQSYEDAARTVFSCLTEPKWFRGSDEIFQKVRGIVTKPMIRKDFTVDEYQIYQAKVLGADAVLLICTLLDTETIRDYIGICDKLGISALVETHDAQEMQSAVRAGARLIGVNNRNLKDFTVDTANSRRLRSRIPKNVLFVSESGVKTAEDVAQLAAIGADAVLIGETLMRAPDKTAKLQELKGCYDKNQIVRSDPPGGHCGGKRAAAGVHRLCVCGKEQTGCFPGNSRSIKSTAFPRNSGCGRVRERSTGSGG